MPRNNFFSLSLISETESNRFGKRRLSRSQLATKALNSSTGDDHSSNEPFNIRVEGFGNTRHANLVVPTIF
jgi:hypothetical protein